MAATKYTYSLSSDFPNEWVDVSVLREEINDSSISSAGYSYTSSAGDVVDIWFDDALSTGDETTLDGIVAAHLGVPSSEPIKGGLLVEALDLPDPSVSVVGTTGSTTWAYKVSAVSHSGETLPSSAVQVTNGNATLGVSNYNNISWEAIDKAIGYKVYRSTAGGTPSSTGKIAEVPPHILSVDDTGITASGAEASEDRSGSVVIGNDVPGTGSKVLDLKELTTDDSTVTSLLSMLRKSSGTVEAGFGTGLYVRLNDDANVMREVAGLHMLWTDPATGTLESAFRVNLRDGGSAIAEKFKFNHDGSIDIKGTKKIDVGSCEREVSPFAVSYGFEVTISSNNSVPALRFPYNGASNGYARWNMRPPQNYTSGDLTFRLLVSAPSTIANNKDTKWTLRWSNIDSGESLGSWDYTTTQTIDVSNQTLDQLFHLEFPILSSQFDKTDELMPMRIERLCTDPDDDCDVHLYVHDMRLVYTGDRFAGQ